MTIQEQIAALPEWPDEPESESLMGYSVSDARWNDYLNEKIGCALARLALAKEVIADRVQIRDHDDWLAICKLLAALEPPK
jgi:hypothetical protein